MYFGNDYKTDDGTAIRDFIHVVDLADGHVAALNKLISVNAKGKREHTFCEIYNMGNGTGSSVKEVIHTMEEATGVNCSAQNRREETGGCRNAL